MIQIKNKYSGAVLLEVQAVNLHSADLHRADLHSADLRSADLRSADLSGANLHSADLRSADLRSADLHSADLSGADLRSANLSGAKTDETTTWPHFQICPERGSFIAWKKTSYGVVKILVPKDAQRTSSLVGRKCRASHVKVLGGSGVGGLSKYDRTTVYVKGAVVRADSFDPDPRVECTHGIHFFITKQEALEY